MLRQAVIEGLGVACLPLVSVQAELASGKLSHVYQHIVGVLTTDVYAVYPSKNHLPQKTKLLLDYLKKNALGVR
jgi:DNA-binding transcriptional LysR family regulator